MKARTLSPYPTRIDQKNQPTYGDEEDPRHPKEPSLRYLEYYTSPWEGCRIDVLYDHLGYDIWQDDDWLEFIGIYVPHEGTEPTEEEWEEFKELFGDGRYSREHCEWGYWDIPDHHEGEYHELRLLYTHLLKHNLEGMELLLDLDYAHVGQQLFPLFKILCWEGGCRTSLLGLAIFDAQSPEAVKMLLRRGANPNGLLNHKPCSMMGGEFGTEALALSADVFDSTEVRGQVLAALLDGGADAGGFLATTIEPTAAEHAALSAACERASARAKQRWQNVAVLVGTVACWRRFAAEPGSKAAAAAVARVKKRARGE